MGEPLSLFEEQGSSSQPGNCVKAGYIEAY
jgi:hypothetical protein